MKKLESLEALVCTEIPGFEIKYKAESKLMRALGFLATPFNPTFMTSFTTTWGKAVYFPSKVHVEASPVNAMSTLAHEFVHLWDEREVGWAFKRSYIAPQLYSLGFFIAYLFGGSALTLLAFLASYLVGCVVAKKSVVLFWVLFVASCCGLLFFSWLLAGFLWTLVLLGGIIMLGPWPSPGRTKWELRGYTMTIAMAHWVHGAKVSAEGFEFLSSQFVGPNYWYPSWNKGYIERMLRGAERDVETGAILNEKPYALVYGFLEENDYLA